MIHRVIWTITNDVKQDDDDDEEDLSIVDENEHDQTLQTIK